MTAAVNASEYFLLTEIDGDGLHKCREVNRAEFETMGSSVEAAREQHLEWVKDVEFPVRALYHVSEGGFTNRILPLTEAEFAALKA